MMGLLFCRPHTTHGDVTIILQAHRRLFNADAPSEND